MIDLRHSAYPKRRKRRLEGCVTAALVHFSEPMVVLVIVTVVHGTPPSGRVSMWPQPALFAQYSQARQVSVE